MVVSQIESLTETSAPAFVKAGGKLSCEMFYNDEGKRRWYVIGIKPDGSRIYCIIPRTGLRKEYATINRLADFNLRCNPNMETLVIPFKTPEEMQRDSAA